MIEDLWYKNSIVYSLDVDTFMDANGDGIGDFEGLIRRLDYLVNLGVDVIWLAPFQPSPNLDNGYDIADFYGVDPRHGSSGDFVEFIHQAKKRGLKVMIDLVVNHTSDQHPWFQEARRDPHSRYRDWYVWSRERPKSWNEGMVFLGIEESTWTFDEVAGEFYFHRFYRHQPNLNMENPAVREEVRRIIGYWLQLGVDGFRVDALPYVIECPRVAEGQVMADMRFEVIEEIRSFLQWRRGDAVLLGEANVLPEDSQLYFREGRGMHLIFNFWVNQQLFYSLATRKASPLAAALRATEDLPPTAQWAHFLRNHDELDLGRLTTEEREAVFARFGSEASMQIYGRGIRRRLAPMLQSRPHLEMAYSLLLALPGTPVLRYGDEIGMGDDLRLPERSAVRTPMQWTNTHAAGFSTAAEVVIPVVDFGEYSFEEVNVEAQRRDPDSLLRWLSRMIRLRKECLEIGWGEWDVLDVGDEAVLALVFTWRGNAVVTLHNFDDEPHEAVFALEVTGGERLVNLIVEDESRADEAGQHRVTIEACGYRWYRAGDLNYALKQTTEPPPETAPKPKRDTFIRASRDRSE